jgi:glycerophosphoryl diester phosphodiesterase
MMRMRKTLAVSVAVLIVGAAGPARASAPGTCPAVISHRAGGVVPDAVAPENTVAGIQAVTALGATAVEMDVRWSLGNGTASYAGWPVLMHDPTLDRTTNGTGNVADLGLTQILGYLAQDYAPFKTDPAFAAVHVPYAYDFLAATYGAGASPLLHINIAPNQVQMDKLMHYVDLTAGARDRTWFMADGPIVTSMHGWYPDLAYVYIEYPAANSIRSSAAILATGAGAYALPIQNVDLTAAAVAYWHAAGIKVWVWSSDTAALDVQANWKKAADLGVDTLITNNAAAASSYFATYC